MNDIDLLPLAGLRVIEANQDLAVAFAGKQFAALGAEVVLPTGERLPAHTEYVRRYVDDGKVLRGTGTPDVVLTTEVTSDRSSGVIRVIVTDQGRVGPQADWQLTELVAQAASGIASLIGEPGRSPLQMGGHQIDYSTGIMAFTAALIALTGRDLGTAPDGQDIEVSRLETAAYIEWKGRIYSQGGRDLTRGEVSGPLVVRCMDGDFGLYYRAGDWPGVLNALGSPDTLRAEPFDTHGGRIKHRKELADVIERFTAEFTSSELCERLQSNGVPAGPVETARTLIESPQYKHRGFIQQLGTDALQPAVPVMIDGQRPVLKEQSS